MRSEQVSIGVKCYLFCTLKHCMCFHGKNGHYFHKKILDGKLNVKELKLKIFLKVIYLFLPIITKTVFPTLVLFKSQ